MRRSDREITDLGEILSIINDCKVIHLAMVDDGEPYLLPLNFGYACESGAFSFFCHMAGREDPFTEEQARAVEVFAVHADKLSAKARVPHGAQ